MRDFSTAGEASFAKPGGSWRARPRTGASNRRPGGGTADKFHSLWPINRVKFPQTRSPELQKE